MKNDPLTKIVLILSAALFSYLLMVLGYSFSPEVAIYGESQQVLSEARITSVTLYVISGFLLLTTLIIGAISINGSVEKAKVALSAGLCIAITLSTVCISWFMFAH